MTTATVIWANGKTETLEVVRETESQFITGDVNQTRWWKRTGLRVGSMGYVKAEFRTGSFWTQATAKINGETVPWHDTRSSAT